MTSESDVVGSNPEVLPHLEGWGWPIALYLFLGGLAAGLMIFAGALRRDRPERAAIVGVADRWTPPILIIGLTLLWIDLASRWNVWRLYTVFRPGSAMSWGSWILALAMGISLFRFITDPIVAHHMPAPARRVVERLPPRLDRGRVLDALTALTGVGVGVYTGVLLSSLAAREVWASPLLAPLFLASGITAASALLFLRVHPRERSVIGRFASWSAGIELLLLAGYVGLLDTSGLGSQGPREALLSGSHGLALIGLVLVAGLLVPLGFELADHRRPVGRRWLEASSVLTLTGSLSLRAVVLFAGLSGPM